MGVVDQAIHDRVAEGGIADAFVPVLDGHLTGQERRAPSGAILDQFQEIAPFAVTDGSKPPVVQNHEIRLAELREHLAVRAVAACDLEGRQEPRQAEIADGVAMAAGAVSERARNPAFPGPGRPRDEQHAVLLDPVGGGEPEQLRFIEAALRAKVHIFDRRRVAEPRELEEPRQPTILPRDMLSLQEQREAVFEIE